LNKPKAPIRALVFAYHDVGVGCIKALLDAGIQIELVVTHADDPRETIWFGSVAALCQERGIPHVQPEASGLLDLLPQFQKIAPDYIFSFYYRHMIASDILAVARIAALNMHGSLLPKYRGRAPVNWAILHGETETGASLHIMEAKPDAGDIVGQVAFPIDPDEDATAVFAKVSNAAVASDASHLTSTPSMVACSKISECTRQGQLFWWSQTRGWANPMVPGCATGA
jgi:methionyl-tRNA formyltransferase